LAAFISSLHISSAPGYHTKKFFCATGVDDICWFYPVLGFFSIGVINGRLKQHALDEAEENQGI